MLLNVMLPVQGLTGLLMWLGWYRPDLLDRLGGLKTIAPTGAYIKAMLTGWEDVEEPAGETATENVSSSEEESA